MQMGGIPGAKERRTANESPAVQSTRDTYPVQMVMGEGDGHTQRRQRLAAPAELPYKPEQNRGSERNGKEKESWVWVDRGVDFGKEGAGEPPAGPPPPLCLGGPSAFIIPPLAACAGSFLPLTLGFPFYFCSVKITHAFLSCSLTHILLGK